ncbi:MAG: undecaprenyl-diphosphate phosphatase [Candidatus Altiarchaeota archaeon]|nr:undecaprenyl-diphosphate phosphatase [Candidatus Altiarchaeota archaeon]
MELFSVLVLGLMQGFFEWLPISSSGQSMIYLLDYAGLDPVTAFSLGIYMHLGTSAAVLVKYRKTWIGLLNDKRLLRFLLVSSAATGVTGLFLYFLLKSFLYGFDGVFVNGLVGLSLIVTGVVLHQLHRRGFGRGKLKDLTIWEEITVGLIQGFSILPGISRSGVTVAALALNKLNQTEALKLSFLMSVPAVVGAVFLELITDGAPNIGLVAGLIGVTASFVAGYALMEVLLSMSRKIRFDIFCIIFGLIPVLAAVKTVF